MKVAAQQGFWSQRPTLTARGFELGCWLAAGLLAVGLVVSPATPGRPPAQPVMAVVVSQAPDVLAYRRRCIDSVLANDLGEAEEYVVRQINQRCSTRRRTVAPSVGLSCNRPFMQQSAPIAGRPSGCLGG
jgi:hypothetical protein